MAASRLNWTNDEQPMTPHEPSDRRAVSRAVWYGPAFLLLVALAPLPYGFYTLLRWIVCGTGLFLAHHEYARRGEVSGWVVGLAGMALLFNPLFPIPLTREMWAPLDFGAAIALFVHCVAYRRSTVTASHATHDARVPRGSRTPAVLPTKAVLSRSASTPAVPIERDAHPIALAAGVRLQTWEIVRVLGAGGFGITYLAFDDTLNAPVAIKEYFYAGLATRISGGEVVPSSTQNAEGFTWGRTRFLDEARLLVRLAHPNIVRVHQYFEMNNTAYLVMDYVEGESLATVLKQHGSMTPAQWRYWLDPLLDALEHVHQHKYLHRDVKPANIVIRADPAGKTVPVLVDFGSARHAAAEKTRHLTAVHTPGYAPIEQYSATSRQGPATDIYALAAVTYRVLVGEPPPDAVDRSGEDEYRPLVECLRRPGDRFLAAVDGGLALRAADRPQSVAAWRAELTGNAHRAPRLTGRPHAGPHVPGHSGDHHPLSKVPSEGRHAQQQGVPKGDARPLPGNKSPQVQDFDDASWEGLDEELWHATLAGTPEEMGMGEEAPDIHDAPWLDVDEDFWHEAPDDVPEEMEAEAPDIDMRIDMGMAEDEDGRW